VFNSINISFTR